MDSATPLIEALGWTLVHFLWEGAVLAAMLWLVLRGMRQASAGWHYAAAALVLGAMVVAAAATLIWKWPAAPDRATPPSAGEIQSLTAPRMTESDRKAPPAPPAAAPLELRVRSDGPWSPAPVARPVTGPSAGLAIRQ